ncbi:MAG: hypothetical protein COA44_04660 [Arcobacter sp.]|nr:MAG: hypothetical protein COA44_04660 [Arcobacter sp.]
MLVVPSHGHDGIAKYLRTGAKVGRDFTRDEMDKRVFLNGDLDVTDKIIQSLNTKDRYMHYTLSFKEDYVSEADLKKSVDEFKKFMGYAFNQSEFNFYAEAHLPKVKSYLSKKGEVTIKKPHIHIVVPNVNLLTGKQLNPFGFTKNNLHYIDGFQEVFNDTYSFASPKNNPKNEMSPESEIISRFKGDLFERNKPEKEDVLNHILENKITSYDDLKKFIEKEGTLKIRNAGKKNEYLNLKYPHQAQGINLKEFMFTKEFIEGFSYQDKVDFLYDKSESNYIEKTEQKVINEYEKREANLKDWYEFRAKELKYISTSTKFYKEEYKFLSKEEKLEIVSIKEKEFYEKYNLSEQINKELEGFKNGTQGLGIANSDFSNDNVISQKIHNTKDAERLKEIAIGTSAMEIFQYLKKEKGVTEQKYTVSTKGEFLMGERKLNQVEFLSQEMNISSIEITRLQDRMQNIKLKTQGFPMKVNIKSENDKVIYMQIGSADAAGRFTGMIHDKAGGKSNATAFVVNDKLMSLEAMKSDHKGLYDELMFKHTNLFDVTKSEVYSKELKATYIKNDLSLTELGKNYAASQHNFAELQPIEMGITKFENAKKLDKNFFQIAKEFVVLKYDSAKQNMKAVFKAKPELAASNVVLTLQLQDMKVELEALKSYKAAQDIQAQVLSNQKQNEKVEAKVDEYEKESKMTFGETFSHIKDTKELVLDLKHIKENAPEYYDKLQTSRELLTHLNNAPNKDSLIEIASSSNTQEAKALNMMLDNKIPVKDASSVQKFVKAIESAQSISQEQGLPFDKVISEVVKIMQQVQNDKSKSMEGAER